ncbi:hypothetical protein M9H77_16216 [Catharanthus roseus]|uniref:Uncharacterized protein n=1 Tax=Catharanthus roseus TaxID=4058 RepID=A0ACC0B120_CATRO|nr:hypothetical protein M9H77_16216 [Catharanthus roseus]
MAKTRINGKKKNIIGIVKLKIVVEKLQKSLILLGNNYNNKKSDEDELEFEEESRNVPEDVKEGHFAVIAVDEHNDQLIMKRFIIPLSYLTHPTFLRLLEIAAEEYGFDREGALMIPCRPTELEKILAGDHHPHQQQQWDSSSSSSSRVDNHWGSSCNKTMVKSC